LCSNGRLHDEALTLLSEFDEDGDTEESVIIVGKRED
jgi:hypothetical protein